MEYTEQEIEMLARFIHDAAPPTTLTFEQLVGGEMDSMRRVVSDVLADGSADSLAPVTRAAARLMRDAREQGRRDAESQARSDIAAMQSERDAELDRAVKQAREQGAAEMRDRAIAALRALPDGTWGDERGEMSPWPDAIDVVKALTVPQ